MDREISLKQQTRRRTRIYLIVIATIIFVAFGFLQFKSMVEPAVKRSTFTTSIAELSCSYACKSTFIGLS